MLGNFNMPGRGGPRKRKVEYMMRYFLCVLGMVLIIEGLPYFLMPDKMKPWLQKVAETPEGLLRRLGLVLMMAGLVFVYLGRLT
jgi:uncharacterized protein YjeT (DUF2065 family)